MRNDAFNFNSSTFIAEIEKDREALSVGEKNFDIEFANREWYINLNTTRVELPDFYFNEKDATATLFILPFFVYYQV